jgi:hypothetical protein
MQPNRNHGATPVSTRRAVAPPPVDRACGLGVCDVLRIELDGCQLDSLRAEIDEQRRGFDDVVLRATACGDEAEAEPLRYERQILEMIAQELPPSGAEDDHFVVHGPAAVVSDLVTGAARDAAEELVARLAGPTTGDMDGGRALIQTAHVALAWAETSAATHAVGGYSFDPDSDHVRL